MRTLKHFAAATAGVAIVAAVLSTMHIKPAGAQSNRPPDPVVVTNTPLPVRVADTSGAAPFEWCGPTVTLGMGENPSYLGTFTVPPAKRLVLEHASAAFSVDPGAGAALDLTAYRNNVLVARDFPALVSQGSPFGYGSQVLAVSQPLRMYLDAGTQFRPQAWHESGKGGAQVCVAGYFVDAH